MENFDKLLLDIYMEGFNNELNGEDHFDILSLIKSAYQLGSYHAIIGDEVSSVDEKTDEEILRQIKQQ